MKLTGKCKEDFEKWLKLKPKRYGYDPVFNWLQTEMQYGVYVDFFDSVGTRIILSTHWEDKEYFQVDIHNFSEYYINTRPEARTLAIEKANQIYNSKG
jgi:hypothetical protein